MEYQIGSDVRDRAPRGLDVGQVHLSPAKTRVGKIGFRTRERMDLVITIEQRATQLQPNETASARDKDPLR